jgi:hypothetical protein
VTGPQGPEARTATTRGTSPPPAATTATRAAPTTVLPSAAGARRPPPRPAATRVEDRTSRPAARSRKARLALKRIDPWSVFVFSLIASVFVGIAAVAAVAVLYAVLDNLGVQSSVNALFAEVTGGGGGPLITSERVVGGAAVLAAANIVLLTLLATLGALLYNLCASFTGGVELTLGERDG